MQGVLFWVNYKKWLEHFRSFNKSFGNSSLCWRTKKFWWPMIIEIYFWQDCCWRESNEGDWEKARDGSRDYQDDEWGLAAGGTRTGLTNKQSHRRKKLTSAINNKENKQVMNDAWQLKVPELDQTPGPKNFPALIAKVLFTGCLSLTELLLPSVWWKSCVCYHLTFSMFG